MMAEREVTASSDPLKAVADAMEAAVEAAREGAADARESVERALPVASSMFSKFAYNASYTIAYGVVFPTVLVARSVPQNNAVVHGLIDGARAAMDMVDEMKKENAPAGGSSSPEALTSGAEAASDPGGR
jgi:hypothetical protein